MAAAESTSPASGQSREQEEAHASYLRWQEIALKQMGYTLNLVLTLTTASLGFGVNLLAGGKVPRTGPGSWVFRGSLIILVAAVAFGLLANCSRLLDFRYTRRAARHREKLARAVHQNDLQAAARHEAEHDKYDCYSEALGKCTWVLLAFQSVGFALGVLLLAAGMWLSQ
jgi:hypothetical protein